MTDRWKQVAIAEIAEVARGGSPRPIKKYITTDPDGVNWIKIGDTKKGGRYVDSTREKITRDGIRRSRWVESGDFLLSNSMSFGRPYILRTSGCIHDGWLVLKPDYSRVDQNFLYYALSSPDAFSQFEGLAAGATVRNLNIELVSGVKIPLPPLDEQKRIVAVLDQAFDALDRARAHAEANLADADSLWLEVVESNFTDRKSWPSEELSSRVRFIDYRGRTPKKTEEGVPLITAKNVRMGFVRQDPQEFIATDDYDSWMTRGIPRRGDVLFTTEAPLANVAQLETDGRVALAQRLITMQPEDGIDSAFLKWSLISPQMQSDIKAKGTGATVTGIKAKLLKSIPLYVPDIEHQLAIVDACECAFRASAALRREYESKLIELAGLRESLLEKAFSGQLI